MFNALASLGGAGQLTADLSNKANTILYAVFAAMALVSGSLYNYFGPRITLAAGGVGYALYSASFWCYNHTSNEGFVLFSGAACGVSAAFLWYVYTQKVLWYVLIYFLYAGQQKGQC